MPSYIYAPTNPHADSNGFVEKEAYYMHKWANEPDNRMLVGNKPVKLRFISDEMPPTIHMISGKLYTSKKKFRDETKARGCIEVGNDTTYTKPRKQVKLDKKQRRNDIKRALYEVRNGGGK